MHAWAFDHGSVPWLEVAMQETAGMHVMKGTHQLVQEEDNVIVGNHWDGSAARYDAREREEAVRWLAQQARCRGRQAYLGCG